MALEIAITGFQTLSTSATSTVTLEVSGFGTPTAAILLMTRHNTSDGAYQSGINQRHSIGFTDGTAANDRVCAVAIDEGPSTMITARRTISGSCVAVVNDDDASVLVTGTFNSWSTDGVTLDVSSNGTSSVRVRAILIKGVSAEVGTGGIHATQNSVETKTGLGFEPRILFTASNNGVIDTALTHDALSIGCAINSDGAGTIVQRCYAYKNQNGSSTVNRNGYLDTNALALQVSNTGTIDYSVELTAWNSDGWDVTTKDGNNSGNDDFIYLALSDPQVSIDLQTFTSRQNTTGDKKYTTGFDTTGIIALLNTVENVDTGETDEGFSLGAADENNSTMAAVGWGDQDGSTTGNPYGIQTTKLCSVPQFAGSTPSEVASVNSITSWDSDGVTVNWDKVGSAEYKGWLFAFEVSSGTTVSVGLVSETDSAFSVTPLRIYTVGLSSETDSAFSVTPTTGGQVISVGLASETDTALATTALRTYNVGLSSESDTSLSVTPLRTISVGLSSESDTALSVTPERKISVGLASETDTSLAVSSSKTAAVGLATETDSALAVTSAKTVTVGLAQETDTALAVTVSGAVQVGLSEETDTALSITAKKTASVGLSTESDSALAITAIKAVTLGLTAETDSAFTITPLKTVAASISVETDSALSITVLKTVTVGLASETDTALTLESTGPISVEGAELKLSSDRTHYKLSGDKVHYKLSGDKVHYKLFEETP